MSLNWISRRSFQARARHRNTQTSRFTAGAVSMSKNWDRTSSSRTPAPNPHTVWMVPAAAADRMTIRKTAQVGIGCFSLLRAIQARSPPPVHKKYTRIRGSAQGGREKEQPEKRKN